MGYDTGSDPSNFGEIQRGVIRELRKGENGTIDPRTGKPWKWAIDLSDAEFRKALQDRAWRQDQSPKPAKPMKKIALGMTDDAFAEAVRNRAWLQM